MKHQQHDCVGKDLDHDLERRPLIPGKARTRYFGPLHFLLAASGIDDLVEHFGYKLLVMLFASQHLMKGFAGAITGPSASFIFKSYNVAGPQMQIYGGVTQLPWAMKPVIGLLSDALPIRGYHKAPYILVASMFGVVSLACIGAMPQTRMSVTGLVTCLFLVQLQFSTCDLLTEAKYAEKMQSHPKLGPKLMTFVWLGLQTGGLVATLMVGPMLNHFGPHFPYIVALVPAAFIMWPMACNYMEETPKSHAELVEARARLLEQKEACGLCFLMFIGTMLLTGLGIFYESAAVNAVAAIVVALVMLIAFSVVLKPVIAKVNAFFLIQTSVGLSIGGASFYFFTDTPEQYPEGPHFSMEFFTSVLGTVGSVCSMFGIYSYQKCVSEWSYRSLLWMTNIIVALLSVTDLIIFTRTNLKFGIPDHAFVLGSSVLGTIIGQWMWMPGIVILSQLCPKGMEAIMYALLAGCHNLGNTIASNCGALLLEYLGCQPSGAPHESSQFRYLWVGSALSTVLPLISCALIPWLIPDARQTDKLLDENDRDATAGSLWRRWTASRETTV
eukprot:TRINITY_DN15972_c0_g1_i1.p1 TRINITY_DN15972_c0_g1~~TRINITY_DN15972_c0_g1_i1.p1  ORF type:complete len:569 (+),score=44.36 TRINITY_DN15972_c0_g1_i1:40-1707(+)